MERQLNANVSNVSPPFRSYMDFNKQKLNYEKTVLKNIINHILGRHCITVSSLRRLKELCENINSPFEFSARLRDLSHAFSDTAPPSVSTQRRLSLAAGEIDELKEKNRRLVQENQILREKVNSSKLSSKEEFKIAYKNLEAYNAELKKEIEDLKQHVDNLEQEIALCQEKLAQKKNDDVKRA